MNKIRRNRRNQKWYHRNTKNHNRILWTIIHQQIQQPKRDGQISINIQHCSLVAKLYPIFLWPYGLYPTTLLCPWDFPGKNTRVGCHLHILPKVKQGEINNLNRLITRSERESIIRKTNQHKKLPINPGSHSFMGEFYQTHKEFPKDWRKRECSQRHSMKPPSPWYQNQTSTPPKRIITGQYLWWIYMQKFSTNY